MRGRIILESKTITSFEASEEDLSFVFTEEISHSSHTKATPFLESIMLEGSHVISAGVKWNTATQEIFN